MCVCVLYDRVTQEHKLLASYGVCVETQQRTLTGPGHHQDTTANGRKRGLCAHDMD